MLGKFIDASFAATAGTLSGIAAASMTSAELVIPDWRHLLIHAVAGISGAVVLVWNTPTGKSASGILGLIAAGAVLGGLAGPAVVEITGQPYFGLSTAGFIGYSVLGFIANPGGWLRGLITALIERMAQVPPAPPKGPPDETK